MANKKKKKRLGAGAVTLSVLFTLILAAGAVYGLLVWGGSRPAPADLGEAAAAADKTVALYVPGESTEGQAPEPAAAVLPETARSEEYGYDEINLNAGCPSKTVTSHGKGAALLSDPSALDRLLDRIFSL